MSSDRRINSIVFYSTGKFAYVIMTSYASINVFPFYFKMADIVNKVLKIIIILLILSAILARCRDIYGKSERNSRPTHYSPHYPLK